MKKLIQKIAIIKTSRVQVIWGELYKAKAIRSLYLFGVRICDVETRPATRREIMKSLSVY